MFPYHTTKQCRICGKTFPLNSDYWNKHSTKDGFRHECKQCIKKRNRKYYEDNIEQRKQYASEYRNDNPEKVAASKRDHVDRNREKVYSYHRQYRKDNPEKMQQYEQGRGEHRKEYRKAYNVEYKEKNKDKLQRKRRNQYLKNKAREFEYAARRRAKKQGADGIFTEKEVTELYAAQNGMCFHCNMSLEGIFHRDHWIPLSRGGSNWIGNIRLLCEHCNLSKGAKLPCEWNKRYCD